MQTCNDYYVHTYDLCPCMCNKGCVCRDSGVNTETSVLYQVDSKTAHFQIAPCLKIKKTRLHQKNSGYHIVQTCLLHHAMSPCRGFYKVCCGNCIEAETRPREIDCNVWRPKFLQVNTGKPCLDPHPTTAEL